jgi:hypothetical protein
MKKLIRIINSMNRPAFWLLVSALSVLAVWFVLAAFQVVKSPMRYWPF